MKSTFAVLAFFILTGLLAVGSASGEAVPAPGQQLDPIWLAGPVSAADQAYLGLSSAESFDAATIDARLLVIQIFSMYCPHCQREAPHVNRFFRLMQDRSDTAGIKMVGIGVGNSEFEVSVFKNEYKIPFPLFADGEYKIHQQIGEVRTPFYIVAQPTATGMLRVIHVQAGRFASPQQFLQQIIALAPPL